MEKSISAMQSPTLMACWQALRKSRHEHYVEEHTEDTQVVDQISQAQEALKTGSSTALLQKTPMLRAADRHLAATEKQRLVSFLSGEKTDPGYVMGILGAMSDDTKEEIVTDDKNEDTAEHTYEELEGSKKVEISTLLEQFERKMKRIGELKVDVVNMKKSMEGAGQSLADDKKMLAELKTTCEAKAGAAANLRYESGKRVNDRRNDAEREREVGSGPGGGLPSSYP